MPSSHSSTTAPPSEGVDTTQDYLDSTNRMIRACRRVLSEMERVSADPSAVYRDHVRVTLVLTREEWAYILRQIRAYRHAHDDFDRQHRLGKYSPAQVAS